MSFLKFANSFQAVARLRLESISALLDFLGNPQKELKFIHIAGTNGKGSVCAFLQSILTLAGFKTGKYTSPNMVSVCERINIDGENISEAEMKKLMDKVQVCAEKVQEKLGEMPTPFEIWTAAAFCRFSEQKCDIVVLETGLGGERDATNIIPPPEIAVITRIALDHTEYLGNTFSSVAKAKAGIIKEGSKVITLAQENEAMEVLLETCAKKGCHLTVTQSAQSLGFENIYEKFSYKGISDIKSSLGGIAQIENACLAIECALTLGIPEDIIKQGIQSASHMGRLEIVSQNPLILFDGAHNINGTAALLQSLNRYFPHADITFVMGVMADKEYDKMLAMIKEHGFKTLKTVTVSNNPRALSATDLALFAKEKGFNAKAFENIRSALENLDGLTVICGSLYLYKDYKEM